MTTATTTRLVCPKCHDELERASAAGLRCQGCGTEYPIQGSVPSFCTAEAFYEDYLEEHCPFVRSPRGIKGAVLRVLPYWSWREWRFFDRNVPAGSRILDLGCARGKEWFSAKGTFVAGVDPTPGPLEDCATHYDLVAQAEITALPFPDESFDCVVTSHVIGHIPHRDKDRAFSEINRVLRLGGVSVNIIETDSNHAFAQLGKSDQDLYVKNFIETDGHIGLELPSELSARLVRNGFAVEEMRKMESGWIHLRYYEKYLGKGFPERNANVRRRMARWRTISGNPLLLGVYEVVMGTYHRFVEQRTAKLDNAMFVGVVARKTRAADVTASVASDVAPAASAP